MIRRWGRASTYTPTGLPLLIRKTFAISTYSKVLVRWRCVRPTGGGVVRIAALEATDLTTVGPMDRSPFDLIRFRPLPAVGVGAGVSSLHSTKRTTTGRPPPIAPFPVVVSSGHHACQGPLFFRVPERNSAMMNSVIGGMSFGENWGTATFRVVSETMATSVASSRQAGC